MSDKVLNIEISGTNPQAGQPHANAQPQIRLC